MKILVTGADGQLGNTIKSLLDNKNDTYIFANRSTLDITNINDVQSFFKNTKPELIINCAGYTAVDKAESDIETANKINNIAVANLTELAQSFNIPLIHISTDYVFNGDKSIPYTETDSTDPLSEYAKSKANGEKHVIDYQKGIVIRTSWLFSLYGNNFVKTIIRLSKERKELKVVFDQVGTPTFANDLVNNINCIIDKLKNNETVRGVYHFSNEGVCSWYDFAWEIVNYYRMDCLVLPIKTSEYPLPAKRPAFSVLNKEKIKNLTGLKIPHWKESLYKCLGEIK